MDSQFCWEYSWNSFNFSVIYSVSSLATGCDESAGGLKKTTAVTFDLCREWKLELSVKIEINMPNGEQLSLMLLVKCNRAGALVDFLSPPSLANSACSFVFANQHGEKVQCLKIKSPSFTLGPESSSHLWICARLAPLNYSQTWSVRIERFVRTYLRFCEQASEKLRVVLDIWTHRNVF